MAMPPGMAMGAPGGGFGAPQQQQPPCMDDFMKLRGETERRGKAIQAAEQAQGAAGGSLQADRELYRSRSEDDQLRRDQRKVLRHPAERSRRHEEAITPSVQQLRSRVCDAAAGRQAQQPKGPSFSDVLGTATLPEASTTTKSGGSTFDTLNGNALAPR